MLEGKRQQVKYIFKSGMVYGIANGVSKLSNIILVPFYTRSMSMAQFGQFDLYITMFLLAFTLFEGEMASGFMRFYHEAKSQNELKQLTGSIIRYYLLSNFFLWGLYAVFYIFFHEDNFFLHHGYLLSIVLLGIFSAQVYGACLIILRMQNKLNLYLLLNVSQMAFAIGLGFLFVVHMHWGIVGALWAYVLSKILLLLPCLFCMYKTTGIKLTGKYIKPLCQYSLPTVPAVLSGWALTYTSRLFIIGFLTFSALGIYSVISKIGMLLLMIVETFNLMWSPYVMRLYHGDEAIAKKTFSRALASYFCIAGVLALVVILIIPFLIRLLAPLNYFHYYYLAVFTVLIGFWRGALMVVAIGNDWVKKTYHNTYGVALGALISALLMWLFIKDIGLLVVFVSILVGTVVMTMVTLWTSQRNVYIPYNNTLTIISLLVTAAYSAGIFVFSRIDGSLFEYYLYNFAMTIVVVSLVLAITWLKPHNVRNRN